MGPTAIFDGQKRVKIKGRVYTTPSGEDGVNLYVENAEALKTLEGHVGENLTSLMSDRNGDVKNPLKDSSTLDGVALSRK